MLRISGIQVNPACLVVDMAVDKTADGWKDQLAMAARVAAQHSWTAGLCLPVALCIKGISSSELVDLRFDEAWHAGDFLVLLPQERGKFNCLAPTAAPGRLTVVRHQPTTKQLNACLVDGQELTDQLANVMGWRAEAFCAGGEVVLSTISRDAFRRLEGWAVAPEGRGTATAINMHGKSFELVCAGPAIATPKILQDLREAWRCSGAAVEFNNIASPSGCREAPAALLLALAHGLATGEHWWLMSPADRVREGWALPAPANLAEAASAYRLERNPHRPCTRLSDGAFEWVPMRGGDFDNPASRRVIIRVEDGASTGTIEWSAGAPEEGSEFICSSFLASILVVLPDAQDDGTLARYIAAGDRREARRIATLRAAKAAGVTRDIMDPATGFNISRSSEFHLGRQPRRAWSFDGQEHRFARWLQPDECEALVAVSEPLPWRVAE